MDPELLFNEFIHLSDRTFIAFAKKMSTPRRRELRGRLNYLSSILERVIENDLFASDETFNNDSKKATGKKDVFTVREFADELDCSESHIRNMIKKKKLQFEDIHATGKRKQIRIPLKELERLQKKL